MQFIDEAKIYLKSGKGGNGCVSFRREKYVDMGGPDGGNGGRGGGIVIESDAHINTLLNFRYKQHFKAQNGENGKGSNKTGASRDPVILRVPLGTQVLSDEDHTLLYDFTEPNQSYEILKGGKGGLGNSNFKTSVNQAPRKATEGQSGQEMWVWLKLKILSDIGLIGMPNAGKSTFLSRVTCAKPKIADYPFTTLSPGLGVARLDDEEFVIADIPGLIQGAHLGAGLGIKFLKHIERCRVLLHLIDATCDNVAESYQTIRTELASYSELLAHKPEIIALNKCDALSKEEAQDKAATLSKALGKKVYIISAHSGMGVKEVLSRALETTKHEAE